MSRAGSIMESHILEHQFAARRHGKHRGLGRGANVGFGVEQLT